MTIYEYKGKEIQIGEYPRLVFACQALTVQQSQVLIPAAAFLYQVCIVLLCVHGFSPGNLASSHITKTFVILIEFEYACA